MLKQDNLHFDSQQRLRNGIKKIADAVGGTMGTGGSNAVIEAIENPGHILTNDGYSIANSIVLSDPIEDMGRKMLLESINRANKASGDGSSTTCVLTASIIDTGLSYKDKAHPMDIKKSLEECITTITESLEAQSRQLFDENGALDLNLLEQVATISAEDEEIGKRIASIYQEIGKDGIIYWDISKTTEDSHTIGSGITVEGAGYLSPYLCDATDSGQNSGQVRLKKPKILITRQKITSASDFDKIGASLYAKEVKDIIVFCDEIDPLVIPDLVKTRQVRGFRIIPVKMPVLWKDWWYEDLAKATGATAVDPEAGLTMKMLTEEHLGTCDNIIVAKNDTYLDGIQDLSQAVQELKEENTDDSLLRAARLNTKTARYFVGAQSDSALSYRRLKVEDAISASYQALNGGIVAGGGTALLNISRLLPNTIGGEILREALCEPIKRIISNSGHSEDIEDLLEILAGDVGFDTREKEPVNMFEAGIIDPKNVVINAVKNALSVAATVLTAPTIVTLPREDYDPSPLEKPEVIKR